MGQVKYFDWYFKPVPATEKVYAIQAVTDDGRVIGRASLVNCVWGVTADGQEARTYDGSDPDAVITITSWFRLLLETKPEGEAAQ